MSIPGHVPQRVVVFAAAVSLPEGTPVRVEPLERADQPASIQGRPAEGGQAL
jgi:hypothetical protein